MNNPEFQKTITQIFTEKSSEFSRAMALGLFIRKHPEYTETVLMKLSQMVRAETQAQRELDEIILRQLTRLY